MTREDSIRYFVESAREVLWSRKTLDGWLLLYLMFAAIPVYAGFQVLKVEKNPDKLQEVYEAGRKVAERRIDEIREYLDK